MCERDPGPAFGAGIVLAAQQFAGQVRGAGRSRIATIPMLGFKRF
jgi:hypothetical protein